MPGWRAASSAASCASLWISLPSTEVITSPGRSPAEAAGPPGDTDAIAAPARCRDDAAALEADRPSVVWPGLDTWPAEISCPAMRVTVSDGMAKPMPVESPDPALRAAPG